MELGMLGKQESLREPLVRSRRARQSELVQKPRGFYQGMASGLEGILHKLKQMDLGSEVKQHQRDAAKEQVSQQKELLDLASTMNSEKGKSSAKSILRNLQKELFASIDVKSQARRRIRSRQLPPSPPARPASEREGRQAVKQVGRGDEGEHSGRHPTQEVASRKQKQNLRVEPRAAAAPRES
ncbi:hypothetical protein GUITHDRAFT_153578, partial [Guillardia theta CCMP2712]